MKESDANDFCYHCVVKLKLLLNLEMIFVIYIDKSYYLRLHSKPLYITSYGVIKITGNKPLSARFIMAIRSAKFLYVSYKNYY